jgi:Tol biopolymer transport system component
MEDNNLKKKGIVVLVYALLGAGMANFTLWLCIAIGMGIVEMALWAKSLFSLLTATLLISFICALTGGVALVTNKRWGKIIALFSIFISIIHTFLFSFFILHNAFKPWALVMVTPLIGLLLYLFFLVVLWREIKSQKLICFKSWKIRGFLIYTALFIFPLVGILTTILSTESPINDISSLSSNSESVVFAMDDDLYSISMKGEQLAQLTATPDEIEANPNFSAGGKTVCFTRYPYRTHKQIEAGAPYYQDILIANADGSNERILFKSKENFVASSPSSSPDAKKIVFIYSATAKMGGRSSVCEINIDGTGFRELSGSYLMSPVYSLDGKSVYGLKEEYVSEELWKDLEAYDQAAKNLKINVVRIDLETLEQHIIGRIPEKPNMYNLSLSPDAKKIAFIGLSEEDKLKSGKYQYQIYIADTDRSNIKKLTNDPGPKHKPTFTRDGTKIIFIHEEQKYGGKRSIRIMDLDGNNIKTLFTK